MRFQGKNWGVLTLARKNRSTNEVMLSTAGAQSQSAVDTQEVAESGANAVSGTFRDTEEIGVANGMGLSVLGGNASAIVREHMNLVRQIARKYSQYSPDSFEDLVQVGSIGLLKDHELHLPPVCVAGHLTAHNPGQIFKAPAGNP